MMEATCFNTFHQNECCRIFFRFSLGGKATHGSVMPSSSTVQHSVNILNIDQTLGLGKITAISGLRETHLRPKDTTSNIAWTPPLIPLNYHAICSSTEVPAHCSLWKGIARRTLQITLHLWQVCNLPGTLLNPIEASSSSHIGFFLSEAFWRYSVEILGLQGIKWNCRTYSNRLKSYESLHLQTTPACEAS